MRFTMHGLGKRPDPPLEAASGAGSETSRLFFVQDKNTGLRFLVDTGAAVSVLPVTAMSTKPQRANVTLQAANKSAIATYGERALTLNIGLRRPLRWIFLVADVTDPILGADFLHNYNLLVDMQRLRLVDATTHLAVQGIASISPKEVIMGRRWRPYPQCMERSVTEVGVATSRNEHFLTNGKPSEWAPPLISVQTTALR